MFRKRCPEKLRALMIRFEINQATYQDPNFKEESLKIEFLNPFLRLFGWDTDNSAGYSDEAKNVEFEKVYTRRESRKNKKRYVDYAFKIGNQTKFILEAKKPSTNLEFGKPYARQTRRYGAISKSRIALLSDFEELSIYDSSIKSKKRDEASTARIFHCKYSDYPKHFNFLYALISKQAILTGLHDKILDDFDRLKNNDKRGYYSSQESNLLIEAYRKLDEQLLSMHLHEMLDVNEVNQTDSLSIPPDNLPMSNSKDAATEQSSLLSHQIAKLSEIVETMKDTIASLPETIPNRIMNEIPVILDTLKSSQKEISFQPLMNNVSDMKDQLATLKGHVEDLKQQFPKFEGDFRTAILNDWSEFKSSLSKLSNQLADIPLKTERAAEFRNLNSESATISNPESNSLLSAEKERINALRDTNREIKIPVKSAENFYIAPLYH